PADFVPVGDNRRLSQMPFGAYIANRPRQCPAAERTLLLLSGSRPFAMLCEYARREWPPLMAGTHRFGPRTVASHNLNHTLAMRIEKKA
ncbi:MAG: hypothetical protein ACYSUC_13250, partial [Planctomycetota bacterium]